MSKEYTDNYRFRVCYIDKELRLGNDWDLMTAAVQLITFDESEARTIADNNRYPKKQFYWQPSIFKERKVLITTIHEEWETAEVIEQAPMKGKP